MKSTPVKSTLTEALLISHRTSCVYISVCTYTHIYTLNFFLSVSVETYINRSEIVFSNLFLLLSNLLLTSFVVGICRSRLCSLTAMKDSVVGVFHSLFSLVPIERFLSCLKFFLCYLQCCRVLQ